MAAPNWFFGFPVDGTFLLDLPRAPSALRLYRPEDAHLTLAFLGGCGAAAAERALGALDEALAHEPTRAIGVSLGAVVPLGPKARYSALSALLVRGRAESESLIGALRDPLSDAASVPRERRPPLAHVTLARPKRRASDEERANALTWARGLDLAHVELVLSRIALYTWSDDRRERLFRVTAERAL